MRRGRGVVTLLALVVGVGVGATSRAMLPTALGVLPPLAEPLSRYPIAPHPARTLFAEASLVVLAKVESIVEVVREGRTTGVERVTLTVERAFKGVAPKPVVVSCDRWVTCPAEARFSGNTTVVAFLDPQPLERVYSTVARSWGVRTVLEGERDDWIAALEGLATLASATPEQRRAQELGWIVATAERAATRWEGAYELAQVSSPDPYFDLDDAESGDAEFGGVELKDEAAVRKSALQPAWRELSLPQRARLKTALLGATAFGPGERCLERCFNERGNPALLRWLFERIEVLARERPEEGPPGDDRERVAKKRFAELTLLLRRYVARSTTPRAGELAAAVINAYSRAVTPFPSTVEREALHAAVEQLRPPPR